MNYIENKPKERREQLIAQGIMEPWVWKRGGNDVTNLYYSNFGSTVDNEVWLILLFRQRKILHVLRLDLRTSPMRCYIVHIYCCAA